MLFVIEFVFLCLKKRFFLYWSTIYTYMYLETKLIFVPSCLFGVKPLHTKPAPMRFLFAFCTRVANILRVICVIFSSFGDRCKPVAYLRLHNVVCDSKIFSRRALPMTVCVCFTCPQTFAQIDFKLNFSHSSFKVRWKIYICLIQFVTIGFQLYMKLGVNNS